MPQNPVEAFIERIIPDMALLDEAIENKNISDRSEIIFTEIFYRVLDELRQLQRDLIEEKIERNTEDNLCIDNASSVFKGSSPKRVGYAFPTKEIEQRFNDSNC